MYPFVFNKNLHSYFMLYNKKWKKKYCTSKQENYNNILLHIKGLLLRNIHEMDIFVNEHKIVIQHGTHIMDLITTYEYYYRVDFFKPENGFAQKDLFYTFFIIVNSSNLTASIFFSLFFTWLCMNSFSFKNFPLKEDNASIYTIFYWRADTDSLKCIFTFVYYYNLNLSLTEQK